MARKNKDRGSGLVSYRCIHRLWHSEELRTYEPGSEIELDPEKAAILIEVGAIEEIQEVGNGKGGTDGARDQPDRADA